ncbi:MAG: type II toxin-antitoxin system VapC family toxin [Chloroflexi bacterium]|nr:type II toxin-antitoxin system VapC family toxin [Chloroflexota bacterium]
MTNGDASPLFVDTNILVYANSASSQWHAPAQQALESAAAAGVELWISRQTLREYLAVVTRQQYFPSPLPVADAIARVQYFETIFQIAEDGPAVMARLLLLLQQVAVGGRQIHDANIVATMQAHGIRRLLTHNVADFTRFAAHVTVVPLVAVPGG